MRIIHCFRSPVGGIFRHVRDLLAEQNNAGYSIGLICDSTTGGAYEEVLFEEIRPALKLGLHRLPMARSISPKDPFTLLKIQRLMKQLQPDIVHAHSAKGGVYGRLAGKMASSRDKPVLTFYCPHGGAMHYDRKSVKGRIFFAAERFLERYTDSLIFISGYEQAAYHEKVGAPGCAETIIYNGLPDKEFEPVKTGGGASDFLYIGMMRDLKGPDVFIKALRIARDTSGLDLKAMFVGDGDDKPKYIDAIEKLGLAQAISVHPAMPAREAFSKAKIVVVPSRAESLPYLVLEAMAAQKPIVSTDVGGIHEIFAQNRNRLVEPDNPESLAGAMLSMYHNKLRNRDAKILARDLRARFSLSAMAGGIEKAYDQAKARQMTGLLPPVSQ